MATIALVAVPGIAYRLGMRPIAWFVAYPLRRLGGGRWPGVIAGLLAAEHRIGRLLTDPGSLVRFAVVTALLFAVSTTQLILVAAAFGVSLAPLAAWGALGLAITAGVVSFLPFGLGVADLVLVALLEVLGVDSATAAAITFTIGSSAHCRPPCSACIVRLALGPAACGWPRWRGGCGALGSRCGRDR